jgi:GntR family transcriptional regulator
LEIENMAIWFDVDPKNGIPIFKQVVEQVKRAIATGMLKTDEQLPTVRELAEEHSINPNTIGKAYQLLEGMGLVYTRPGVRGGTFVARGVEAGVRELELERFQESLRKVVREGYNLGLTHQELEQRFQLETTAWYEAHPLLPEASGEVIQVTLSSQNVRKLYSAKE